MQVPCEHQRKKSVSANRFVEISSTTTGTHDVTLPCWPSVLILGCGFECLVSAFGFGVPIFVAAMTPLGYSFRFEASVIETGTVFILLLFLLWTNALSFGFVFGCDVLALMI
jgi:hypothetical protein